MNILPDLRGLGLLVCLLLASPAALAQPDARLASLEAAYNRIQLEQQSAYQQFQMLQELRRNEQQQGGPPNMAKGYVITGVSPTTGPVDYDENIRLQRERQERLSRYDREINEAYARFVELGNQKQAILEQISALSGAGR